MSVMLDAPVPLALVAAFLDAHEILALRIVNHNCCSLLPLHTRVLVIKRRWLGARTINPDTSAEVEGVPSAHKPRGGLAVLAHCFPLIATLALRGCSVHGDTLTSAFTATNWRATLRVLELSALLHVTDRHLELCAQLLPALETLVVAQCYQVKTPTLASARLRSVRLQNGFFTRFAAGTHLPALQELRVTSQVLTTLDARHLVKRALPESGAPLRLLSLANCGAVTQLFVDPTELPTLRALDLRCCHALERVHVASRALETLDLSLCVELQVAVLDLPSARSVDLSFLKALTQLFLNAKTLEALDLTGCAQLERQHLRVACPALQVARLNGASVDLSDLTRAQDMVVPLELP
ncbi:hypothetical protein PybrP1_005287 [[Pythium] brassicae (nom. inval.)]|nr:hypothetical protein PybrP1_005287 [[Pythium] brassicae (nom. inval.)]